MRLCAELLQRLLAIIVPTDTAAGLAAHGNTWHNAPAEACQAR